MVYNPSVRSNTLHFNRFKKKNGQNGHFEKEILSLSEIFTKTHHCRAYHFVINCSDWIVHLNSGIHEASRF